jgi:NAD(P)-dependent dehydrogenase (short-subunit alcohol dehydrogenase family)
MAEALTEAGARVVVTGRDRGRAEAVAAQLGAGAVGLELDVRDQDSVQTAVADAYRLLGSIDVLINNAGIGMRTVHPRFLTEPQPFWEVSPAGFRDVIETKATGTFLLARAVVPRMLEAGSGRVINISMNEQTMTRRGFVPYGPSGAAVEALPRVIAADLAGSSVTVNILLPGGATATGMIPDDVSPEIRAGPARPRGHGTTDRLARVRRSQVRPRSAHRRYRLRRLAEPARRGQLRMTHPQGVWAYPFAESASSIALCHCARNCW